MEKLSFKLGRYGWPQVTPCIFWQFWGDLGPDENLIIREQKNVLCLQVGCEELNRLLCARNSQIRGDVEGIFQNIYNLASDV